MPLILVGTLDTKGVELAFVRGLLHQHGLQTLVIDAGVLGPPHLRRTFLVTKSSPPPARASMPSARTTTAAEPLPRRPRV